MLRAKRAIHIFSTQKLIKNAQYGQFWRAFENSVTGHIYLVGQKLVENAQIQKLICDIWSNFQTL